MTPRNKSLDVLEMRKLLRGKLYFPRDSTKDSPEVTVQRRACHCFGTGTEAAGSPGTVSRAQQPVHGAVSLFATSGSFLTTWGFSQINMPL